MIVIGNFTIIHKGYLDIFLNKYQNADIYILSNNLANQLYNLELDQRKINPNIVKNLFTGLNRQVYILEEENLPRILNEDEIVLVEDNVITALKNKYLSEHSNIITESGFFYYPQDQVKKTKDDNKKTRNSTDQKDIDFMKQAIELTKKSNCFWRQIASVVVKNDKIIYTGFNHMLPNQDECYKIGCIRDDLKAGTQTEFCSAVHSEASCIAQAAKDGQALNNTSIYVTTFPCPACAKLVALSGIKKCFYNQGWANFDGERVMKAAGVEITKIDI
ncbi:cytidine/deoxycytidylate deaminase family protein [Patescibacteria group bacterium]